MSQLKRKAWLAANPGVMDRYREKNRKKWGEGHYVHLEKRKRAKRYGLSVDELDRLYEKQEGKCAICSVKPRKHPGLQVDHCHHTGKVRGLLCMTCNTRIGFLESTWLPKAQSYLQGAA